MLFCVCIYMKIIVVVHKFEKEIYFIKISIRLWFEELFTYNFNSFNFFFFIWHKFFIYCLTLGEERGLSHPTNILYILAYQNFIFKEKLKGRAAFRLAFPKMLNVVLNYMVDKLITLVYPFVSCLCTLIRKYLIQNLFQIEICDQQIPRVTNQNYILFLKFWVVT